MNYSHQVIKGRTVTHRHYDSLQECVERAHGIWKGTIASAPGSGKISANGNGIRITDTQMFYQARVGWCDGVKAVPGQGDAITAPESEATGWAMSVAGAFPDVGAFMAGDPECMVAPEPVQAPSAVRLVVLPMCSASLDERLAVYAGAVTMLAQEIEAAGISTEVVAASFQHEGGLFISSVVVKELGMPFDLGALAFSCSPQAKCGLWLRLAEAEADISSSIRSGCYGQCFIGDPDDHRMYLNYTDGVQTIVLPSMNNLGNNNGLKDCFDAMRKAWINQSKALTQQAAQAA